MRKYKHEHQPHDGASFYYVAPWPTREAPKASSDVPWCSRQARSLFAVPHDQRPAHGNVGLYAAFGKIRCPDCGRRLQLMTVDIENGYGDFYPYIPPHKIRKLKVKTGRVATGRSVTKDRRGARGR